MTNKIPPLPCLPGFNFDENIGRTKFNKSHFFDKIHKNVYYLLEKPDPTGFDRYPALYAWGEELPKKPWLSYDGQRLKFKAYFQESVYGRKEPFRIRPVDISFFLEDGTMKICEPAIINSGFEQGILVKRQRIPLSDPVHYRYFDILDLNIGMEVAVFGRVYKIIDCDNFTRHFLNHMGIPVPDPLDAPKNLTFEIPKAVKKKKPKTDCPDKFFKYDGQILRFYGYWDDSESPYGHVHDLEIYYYLVDDTIQIFDHLPNEGSSIKTVLVKKIKIPKFFTNIEAIGDHSPITPLNVFDHTKISYYMSDHSYEGKKPTDYYREFDLTIGAQLNVFGRKVMITDLDSFTKEYYRKKYGVDDFTPIEKPGKLVNELKDHSSYIPPYNGFGGYDDSLGNCLSIVPKRPKVVTDKSYTYDNQETDRRVLRFGSKMISDVPADIDRRFVLNIYLIDGTVLIVEVPSKKAGRRKSIFQKRFRYKLPGQNIFSSEKPQFYEPHNFYIGAIVNLKGFIFKIETADEYTFKYMETYVKEFQKSDKDLVMSKIRESLKSIYREFIEKYTPVTKDNQPPILTMENFREAVLKYVGDRISEHEIITIARYYACCEKKEVNPREYVRAVVHTELTRSMTLDLERLEEDIKNLDRKKTGFLKRNQVYTILYANRVPLPKELINLMLDRLYKNENEEIDCEDLLKFINIRMDPLPPVIPTNVKALYWAKEDNPKDCTKMNWTLFLVDLNLEEELKEPEASKEVKKDDENT